MLAQLREVDDWAKRDIAAVAAQLCPSIGIPAAILEVALKRQSYGIRPIDAATIAEQQKIADAFASAGHAVERPRSPISFERLFKIQRSTMTYEAGRALKHLLAEPAGTVGEKITALIREGLEMDGSRYLDERSEIDGMRATLFGAQEADVFLWPAAPGTAPEGLAWTGDPKYISPWTALGGPIASIPAGFADNGLPLGCILSARPGTDAQVCSWVRKLAEAIA